ncbi:MAG TPA: glycosyltransferase family 4 protein [Pyrinomonadaceae bacterium]|nr:glycosyltransferase family 4 protein [Pyrinomonadaceae bacterium]
MRRKIILLGPLPPPYGGVSVFTHSLFESLKRRGAELWAYTGGERGGRGVTRFNHRRLGFVPLLVRGGARARILDSSHFLVEHPNPLLVPLWLLLKLLLRFEWVKVVHDGSLPSRYKGFGPLRRMLCRAAVGSVDEFAVVNDEIGEWLRGEMGVRREVSTLNALLPIPPAVFDAPLAPEFEAKLARHARRVCSTGAFTPDYGFEHAAEAVELLRRESGEDIGLLLIDGTFTRDDEYRERVLRGREWIDVLENVPHPQVLQVFKRCDAFVRGVRYEGYGLSRVEAVWCGTPVVAGRGEESRGILIYDYGDMDALVRYLRKSLFDPPTQEIRRWGEQFRREAEENLLRWERLAGRGDGEPAAARPTEAA